MYASDNKVLPNAKPVALTIAGSDSGGGAGIQADLKTFAAHGVFGCSVISAITAQNTRGVDGIWPLPLEAVEAQVRSVLNDLNVQSIKIGMLFQPEIADVILRNLPPAAPIPLVVDPVLVATSGDALTSESLVDHPSFWQLLKVATVVTPNLNEAAQLLATNVANDQADMISQGEALIDAGLAAVLLKGGHLSDTNLDILLWRDGNDSRMQKLPGKKIPTKNTHGTGCTLAAAIAANLAKGQPLLEAVTGAKQYVFNAIKQSQNFVVGHGNGPLNHFYNVVN